MPQETLRQVNFTSGQLDPSLKGRRDFKSYFTGLLTATNCVFAAQGPIGRRPALAFRDAIRGPLGGGVATYVDTTFPNGVSGAASLDASLGGVVTITTGMGSPTPEAPFVLMVMDIGQVLNLSAVDVVDYIVGVGGDPPPTGGLPPDVGPTFPYNPGLPVDDPLYGAYLLYLAENGYPPP